MTGAPPRAGFRYAHPEPVLGGLDPANDCHMAISENDEYRLRRVAEAADALSILFEAIDNDIMPAAHRIAALFEVQSFAIEGILDRRVEVFPGKRA